MDHSYPIFYNTDFTRFILNKAPRYRGVLDKSYKAPRI
jgi:hypothetical protein